MKFLYFCIWTLNTKFFLFHHRNQTMENIVLQVYDRIKEFYLCCGILMNFAVDNKIFTVLWNQAWCALRTLNFSEIHTDFSSTMVRWIGTGRSPFVPRATSFFRIRRLYIMRRWFSAFRIHCSTRDFVQIVHEPAINRNFVIQGYIIQMWR